MSVQIVIRLNLLLENPVEVLSRVNILFAGKMFQSIINYRTVNVSLLRKIVADKLTTKKKQKI